MDLKMLKLNFKTFRDKIELDQVNGHYPTIHCLEEVDKFTFVVKSKEKWDYYSVVMILDLIDFAEQNNLTLVESITQFKINYCSNTLPLEPEEQAEIFPEEVPPPSSVSKDIDAGQDIVIEAKDYSEFLLKLFNLFERKTMAAIDKITIEKVLNKNFGEFLQNLFNSVNTVAFATNVLKFIKEDLITGMKSAEEELNTDIGFTDSYQEKLAQLQQQQINGYTINGKLWPGIKGVTKEIQAAVIKAVQDGLRLNKSIDEIKKDVKEVYDKFSDWRSEMIARTETTRIINSGKLVGYKETGMEGNKVWSSAIDDRTSDICRRLNDQQQLLDDPFIDPKTHKAYSTPPAHPHCRSVIFFKPF